MFVSVAGSHVPIIAAIGPHGPVGPAEVTWTCRSC